MKSAVLKPGKKVTSLEEQVRVKEEELKSLLQITQAINNNLSSGGLLKLYENILVKIGARKLAVFIYQDEWVCTNFYGIPASQLEQIAKNFLPDFRQIIHLQKNQHPLAADFSVVVPVYHKDFPLAFTFLGDLHPDSSDTLDEKLNYIQVISNVIAVAIENKRLFRAHMKQKFLKSELEMAGQMQTMLIPGKLPDDERLSIAGVYLPHQEVGGDYYDYIELNTDESLFCIGDISGKGVAAALLMANFQASVRSYSEQQPSLGALIESLNARVNEITKGEKYITFFLAKFNYTTREFQYVNAGHNPAILYHDGTIRLLEDGCTILGMFEKLPYVNVHSIKLEKEFVTFCYTDGLTDVENDRKETMDVNQVCEFIEKHHQLSPAEFNKKMVDTLVAFKGNRLINDDISMLTCKIY
jgi:sigma-B regulation protein RsbU (phosphoserine phosphatase)